ncbi:MAG TPA: TraB/GumN family protein, partial [Sphingomicrobium sp.]
MTTVLLAAAALAAAGPAAQPSAAASPAMFVVRDSDTTVYIFGTFHALDGRAEWFKDRVRTAFDDSGELVLETVIP